MNRGPVDRSGVVPYRQLVGDGECLAVADHHAADAIVWHPGLHPGVHTHPGQADLISRSFRVFVGQRRQFLFVRAPAHFGRGDSFFSQSLDAPCVDEFVHIAWADS